MATIQLFCIMPVVRLVDFFLLSVSNSMENGEMIRFKLGRLVEWARGSHTKEGRGKPKKQGLCGSAALRCIQSYSILK
jgi:hypothetical protein